MEKRSSKLEFRNKRGCEDAGYGTKRQNQKQIVENGIFPAMKNNKLIFSFRRYSGDFSPTRKLGPGVTEFRSYLFEN